MYPHQQHKILPPHAHKDTDKDRWNAHMSVPSFGRTNWVGVAKLAAVSALNRMMQVFLADVSPHLKPPLRKPRINVRYGGIAVNIIVVINFTIELRIKINETEIPGRTKYVKRYMILKISFVHESFHEDGFSYGKGDSCDMYVPSSWSQM